MGYGSRKDVKKFIKDGRVKVNNSIILDNEFKVSPYEDEIFWVMKRFYIENIYTL
ncbi:S4 domain-containing protein [Tissierella carlieri]|uniref:S4 domain-containing protein n=1 Tax=Tissierella carlieri TaxID=689904 RepID=UPI0038634DCA